MVWLVFQSAADFKLTFFFAGAYEAFQGRQGRFIILVTPSISGTIAVILGDPSSPPSTGSLKSQTFTDRKSQPPQVNSEIWAESFQACPTKACHRLTSQTSEPRLRKDIFHFHGLEMYNLMSLWGILAGVTLKFDYGYGLRGRTDEDALGLCIRKNL